MIEHELIDLIDALLIEVRSGNMTTDQRRVVSGQLPEFYTHANHLLNTLAEINNKSQSINERIVNLKKNNSKKSQYIVIIVIGMTSLLSVLFPKIIDQYLLALIVVLFLVLFAITSYQFYLFREIKTISDELVEINKKYYDVKKVLDHFIKNLDEISTFLSSKEE